MKLLKLEIGELPRENQFRSLHSGFQVEFHSLTDKGFDAMEKFRPFCFAGLNGSGKSNVLEALSSIFFHLESCVAKYKPKTFEKHFRRNECKPDAFTLEYLIGQHNSKPYALAYFDKITIKKEIEKEPVMFRQAFPFSKNEELIPVSLEPREKTAADGKRYLPDVVVGYSSGENEIISIPFIKSRLINFDKYIEDFSENVKYEEPENSMIYIDNKMSQAVLLACLIFEDAETLKPLKDELGIIDIQSFRMNLNAQSFVFMHKEINNRSERSLPSVLNHIDEKIRELKNIASCYHVNNEEEDNQFLQSIITLDFWVDDNTKKAFRKMFSTSFELFRFFQVLYELNSHEISENIKENVYKSKGVYTDGKLPENSPDEDVFYFLDFLILKQIEDEETPKELLLREFSDGEHQFIHTMGISLMLKERRSLIIFDEPETHFNPKWRAEFIKMLDDSITSGNNRDYVNGWFNVHLLKDIILSSHSPFIISDCLPNNVIFFDRNMDTKKVQARNAHQLGLKTYGSSIDYILKNFFKTNLISKKSFGELKDIIDNGTIDDLRNAVEFFGESSEKQFLFKRIYEKIEEEKNDN